MRLEPTPKPDQVLRVSARLITTSTILHLSSDELERAVTQEQMENPALEVIEHRVCLFCGSLIQGQICASCGHFAQLSQPAFTTSEVQPIDEALPEQQWGEYHHYEIDDYSSWDGEDDEEFDPLASIPIGQSLSEVLLQELEALISPDD